MGIVGRRVGQVITFIKSFTIGYLLLSFGLSHFFEANLIYRNHISNKFKLVGRSHLFSQRVIVLFSNPEVCVDCFVLWFFRLQIWRLVLSTLHMDI